MSSFFLIIIFILSAISGIEAGEGKGPAVESLWWMAERIEKLCQTYSADEENAILRHLHYILREEIPFEEWGDLASRVFVEENPSYRELWVVYQIMSAISPCAQGFANIKGLANFENFRNNLSLALRDFASIDGSDKRFFSKKSNKERLFKLLYRLCGYASDQVDQYVAQYQSVSFESQYKTQYEKQWVKESMVVKPTHENFQDVVSFMLHDWSQFTGVNFSLPLLTEYLVDNYFSVYAVGEGFHKVLSEMNIPSNPYGKWSAALHAAGLFPEVEKESILSRVRKSKGLDAYNLLAHLAVSNMMLRHLASQDQGYQSVESHSDYVQVFRYWLGEFAHIPEVSFQLKSDSFLKILWWVVATRMMQKCELIQILNDIRGVLGDCAPKSAAAHIDAVLPILKQELRKLHDPDANVVFWTVIRVLWADQGQEALSQKELVTQFQKTLHDVKDSTGLVLDADLWHGIEQDLQTVLGDMLKNEGIWGELAKAPVDLSSVMQELQGASDHLVLKPSVVRALPLE